jgi:RNA polymerase sigma-70 factor (ECF subfamily)
VFPDERLKLLFICAHPAIDAAARAPLMLQTVLGLDALRIASAFLVAPATMGQRLVRAKAKIRDAGIAFTIPESEDLAPRLDAVLDAIYAAYGSGWEDVTGSDPRRRGLAEEAIWLARLVVGLLPEEPEARGLLALMLHCEARRPARRGHDGGFVPLSEQDVRRWSQPLIDEAEEQLAQASHAERLGRFQLEAAIQSVHAQRGVTGKTDWQAVAMLYAGLVRLTPAIGASIGHAAAMAEACGAESGLALLLEAPIGSVEAYQPYWALRAHLYRRLGRRDAAAECYGRAIGLTEDPAVRAWLTQRRDGLGEAS